MIRKLSPRNVSIMFTTGSFLVALVSIQLGRRMYYLEHLPLFNSLVVVMLALVGAALVVAFVALVKAPRSPSLWLAAGLAIVVLGAHLLDD